MAFLDLAEGVLAEFADAANRGNREFIDRDGFRFFRRRSLNHDAPLVQCHRCGLHLPSSGVGHAVAHAHGCEPLTSKETEARRRARNRRIDEELRARRRVYVVTPEGSFWAEKSAKVA